MRLPLRFILMPFVLAGLSACGSSADFQGVPQEGASRTGAFPTFARTPKGETKQLTAQDTTRVTSELDAAAARQQAIPTLPPTTQAQLLKQRRQAEKEAADTLKEIETESN
ncbi:hypothetical protein C5748_25455 [Phyllobacterium phragmitis]|uniref:DUF3035 domain-containing protein n=1 Tax=Phyllobacterium phragmitis TaxID=2670329 RepID=A0A2S9IJK5_9HYPH|nr:hypothetical protein [Phyllobacterium phragmitis]PRD40714.1 hypothetical protein C5748_25455 [Phyllobacterium phragmitis]